MASIQIAPPILEPFSSSIFLFPSSSHTILRANDPFSLLHKASSPFLCAMIVDGEKFACEICIRGHRAAQCEHSGKQLCVTRVDSSVTLIGDVNQIGHFSGLGSKAVQFRSAITVALFGKVAPSTQSASARQSRVDSPPRARVQVSQLPLFFFVGAQGLLEISRRMWLL